MQYIFTFKKDCTLDFYDVYHGGKLEDNQTLIRPADGLINPTFNKQTQAWENGEYSENDKFKTMMISDETAEQIRLVKEQRKSEQRIRELENTVKMMNAKLNIALRK